MDSTEKKLSEELKKNSENVLKILPKLEKQQQLIENDTRTIKKQIEETEQVILENEKQIANQQSDFILEI